MKSQPAKATTRTAVAKPSREITSHREWRKKLGYGSMVATLPALLSSHLQTVHSDTAKEPARSVYENGLKRAENFAAVCGNQELLKRQSQFRLSDQTADFDLVSTLGGTDGCPGRPIPSGTYTSVAPYLDAGDTIGANDTVTRLCAYVNYCYPSVLVPGLDHVYTFTLTGYGPNPQIQISTTSSLYEPFAYVLNSRDGECPTHTGNWVRSAAVWQSSGDTTTIDSESIKNLPLNVPLYLFVDSKRSGTNGSGPYTLRIQDVTIDQLATCADPIDCPEFFVWQHYFDFLARAPDAAGLAFWSNEIRSCGSDQQCIEIKRINVSAAFFLSIEFQEAGYFRYLIVKAAFGNRPGSPVPVTMQTFGFGSGFVVGEPGWEQRLENQKNIFASYFTSAFPLTMTPEQFVDKLNTNSGGVLSTTVRNQLVSDLASGSKTRAQVLRAVAEDPDFKKAEFNKAFVLMQYYGYLRRNPNDLPDVDFSGFNFWLNKLESFGGNFVNAEMVKAFINSTEYRNRF